LNMNRYILDELRAEAEAYLDCPAGAHWGHMAARSARK
jgi:hypothetical protein